MITTVDTERINSQVLSSSSGFGSSNPYWNILLIDDDEDDYVLTREMLSETHDQTVLLTWASDYEEGWKQLFSNGKYDLVLMDYDLGIHSGVELAREFISHRASVPVILLTGRGNYTVDLQAMEAGITLYLTKSEVNSLLLERAIRYAIHQKKLENMLYERNARLELLSDLAADLLKRNDPVKLLYQVSERLSRMLSLDLFVHYQLSEDGKDLSLAAIGGYPEEIRRSLLKLDFGQAVCGTVAVRQQPITVQDVQHNEEEMTRLIRRLGVTAYCCHPLIVEGKLFGTLSFGSRTRVYLEPEVVNLLRTVCDLIAVAFERNMSERAA